MVLAAELEQCSSDKDRIAVLEKFVVEARKREEHTVQRGKAGQATPRAVLMARADRLQAEITLENARARAGGETAVEGHAQVALAEKQVAVKRAASKVAEAQRKRVLARATSLRAQVTEAQAAEAFAAKHLKRVEELERQKAVAAEVVEERRAQWEAARARSTAAQGQIVELEAQMILEQARAELAQLEVEEAELRLKCLQAHPEEKRGTAEH